MESRRKILKKIGITTAAAGLTVGAARKARAAESTPAAAAADGAAGAPEADLGKGPWWLVAPLQRGEHLGGGWFLAHLAPVKEGAAVLTLQHAEEGVARVHLCYLDGRPRGLAHTAMLDLILMDGGQGDKSTDERLGRVLMGLAKVIARNELHGKGDLRELSAMQSHDERVAVYGPEKLT